MLKKLMKHEWNALGRLLLPLYGLLFVTAPLAGFFTHASASGITKIQTGHPGIDVFFQTGLGMLLVLLNIMFVLEMIGIVVANIILVAMRFYKTMTGEEAYLTHTLPVSMHALIASKALVASLFEILSSLTVLISCPLYFLCAGNDKQLSSFLSSLGELFTIFSEKDGAIFILHALGIILLGLLSLFATNLHLFASVALGHLITKHRVAGSFGMYVLINYAKQFISFILIYLYFLLSAKNIDSVLNNRSETLAVSYMLGHFEGALLVITMLTIAVLYYITHRVFTRKLNLD